MFNCQACGCESANVSKCEVCGTVRVKVYDSPAMDKLTRLYTAFDSFNEFAQSMNNGYVPTIYSTGKGKKAKAQFVEAIRAAGFKVYDGVKVA